MFAWLTPPPPSVTLLGAALMLFLLISEFYDYTQIVTEGTIWPGGGLAERKGATDPSLADSIYVDTTREKTLWINFDLTVLYVPCDGTAAHLCPCSVTQTEAGGGAFLSFSGEDVEVDILDNFGEVQKGRREIRTQLVDGQASGGWFFGGGPNSGKSTGWEAARRLPLLAWYLLLPLLPSS